VFVTGVVRTSDHLSLVNSATYNVIINASDACDLSSHQSAQLVVNVLQPATPRFTATLYTFSVSSQATPGHVIGYLHLVTGRLSVHVCVYVYL